MCGIVGISTKDSITQTLIDALTVMQHRGQDAAGIAIYNEKLRQFQVIKGNGLVKEALTEAIDSNISGVMGLGHVRYPTAGTLSHLEAQPFICNNDIQISIVHNGNIINTNDLASRFKGQLETTSDSEILMQLLSYNLHKFCSKDYSVAAIFEAVKHTMKELVGAYSVICMIKGVGLLAFRDPYGIRPLIYGKQDISGTTEWLLASESVVLDVLGYTVVADVKPGEAVFIDTNNQCTTLQLIEQSHRTPCLFEYIYLARADSIIDNISVYEARYEMGKTLAKKITRQHSIDDIDVVMPIPDTGRIPAIAIANELDISYAEGFVKNRYITRTFIMPNQTRRKKAIQMKLHAIKQLFRGKNVLLVDDSIVRGNTSKEIITKAKEAGANKVYFASAAPQIKYPNVYGIDMPTANELIASNKDLNSILKHLGADEIIYQDLQELKNAMIKVQQRSKVSSIIYDFEDSVFSNRYITGKLSSDYKRQLKRNRSDVAKVEG